MALKYQENTKYKQNCTNFVWTILWQAVFTYIRCTDDVNLRPYCLKDTSVLFISHPKSLLPLHLLKRREIPNYQSMHPCNCITDMLYFFICFLYTTWVPGLVWIPDTLLLYWCIRGILKRLGRERLKVILVFASDFTPLHFSPINFANLHLMFLVITHRLFW